MPVAQIQASTADCLGPLHVIWVIGTVNYRDPPWQQAPRGSGCPARARPPPVLRALRVGLVSPRTHWHPSRPCLILTDSSDSRLAGADLVTATVVPGRVPECSHNLTRYWSLICSLIWFIIWSVIKRLFDPFKLLYPLFDPLTFLILFKSLNKKRHVFEFLITIWPLLTFNWLLVWVIIWSSIWSSYIFFVLFQVQLIDIWFDFSCFWVITFIFLFALLAPGTARVLAQAPVSILYLWMDFQII